MAGKRKRARRKKRRGAAPLLLAAALLCCAGAAALWFTTREESHTPVTEYISFNGSPVAVDASLPQNSYDPGLFYREGDLLRYDAPGASAGVDVSSHQGEIDWAQVADAGVDFAMIRVGYRGYTEGGLFPDAAFSANIQGALDAGLSVGVYFFSQAVTTQEAEEEARFLLDAVSGYSITLPVVFDWEFVLGETARTDNVDRDTLTECALAFCRVIRRAGYQPGVYFNQSQGYLNYRFADLADCGLWLAEYGDTPTFYYGFQMWQYTETGALPGISGPVDLDICFTPAGV